MAILFELILWVVDEAFRSSNVVAANRASEAIRVELPPLEISTQPSLVKQPAF